MTADFDYTPFELMAAAGARELKDGEIVCVGLGLPIVSSFLAKRTHAPNITILLELGVVDPEPLVVGVEAFDPRIWYRAKIHTSLPICWAQCCTAACGCRFRGALIDAYGNLNSTLLASQR
jgi:glutaconate CoA-transferase subunit B